MARVLQHMSSELLFFDADTTIVDPDRGWLDDLRFNHTQGLDFVVTVEGEGPPDLVYKDPSGHMRLNDAMYANTGVVFMRNSTWSSSLLQVREMEGSGWGFILIC